VGLVSAGREIDEPVSPEFARFVAELRGNPLDPDRPVEAVRAGWEAFARNLADPPPVDREPGDADGVPVEWARPPGGRPPRTVLYLHGGGYNMGTIGSYRDLSARLATRADATVCTVGYRLAPEHPFPAAVDDAVTAYRRLLTMVAPEHVVVAGDSAGAGLSAALTIAATRAGLPRPAGLALVSPLADLLQAGRSTRRNPDLDPLVTPHGSRANARRYLGPDGDPRDPLASPVYADQAELAAFPPTYVQVGTSEILLDDSLRLARRLRDAGVRVDLDVWPGMIHIMPYFAARIPESRAALAAWCDAIRALAPDPNP
jgi:acetyl esterase/lipase